MLNPRVVRRHSFAIFVLLVLFSVTTRVEGEDWPMRGRDRTRNPVSLEKGAPVDWQVAGRVAKPGQNPRNIRWSARLGDCSWGDPVIANGLVWVGTSNSHPRDPKISRDAAVLMCFREEDGEFLYQYVSPRLPGGPRFDFFHAGLASSPLVEGDRLWFCNNRCEIICLNVGPLRIGNEERQLIWKIDMREDLGVLPTGVMVGSNALHSSVAAYQDLIYVNTTNAKYSGKVPAPDAPSLICLDKNTGEVVWKDNSPGENLLDVQHGSPLVTDVNGHGQVIMGQGDGWLRSFDALTGNLLWKFDINYKTPSGRRNRSDRNYFVDTPVFYNNRIYIAGGAHRDTHPRQGRLCCIDPTKEGDVSSELEDGNGEGKPNPNSGLIWEFLPVHPRNRKHRAMSSVAIHDSLVIAPEKKGIVHCLDAQTGTEYWTHDAHSGTYGSPLIVDDKVYIATEDGDVLIFALAKRKIVLAEHRFNYAIQCSPVFANGVLYVMTQKSLYAIQD